MMIFTTTISTDELSHHLLSNVSNADSQNWIIFDCRSHLIDHSAGLKAYQDGHIPNAIFCSLETDLSSPITETTGRHPLPDFNAFIKK